MIKCLKQLQAICIFRVTSQHIAHYVFNSLNHIFPLSTAAQNSDRRCLTNTHNLVVYVSISFGRSLSSPVFPNHDKF